MLFNCDYLNQTANKTPRAPAPSHVIWHETESPNPASPDGTLRYNLAASVGSSYNILIARDGTAYLYVDLLTQIAWQAGDSTLGAWRNYQVNVNSWGVEVDGDGKGDPPSGPQWATMIAVAHWLHTAQGIPLDRAHHHAHKEIAPGRKHDPEGYTVDELIRRATSPGL